MSRALPTSDSCLLGWEYGSQSEVLNLWQHHATASATAPAIPSVTMQVLYIKCKWEICLANGSILCHTDHRALFSSEQMSISTLMLLSFMLANTLMHQAPFHSVMKFCYSWIGTEDVGRHNFYSIHWSIICSGWEGWGKQVNLLPLFCTVMIFLWYKGKPTAAYKRQQMKSLPLHLCP